MAENSAFKAMTEFYDRNNASSISDIEERISNIDIGALAEQIQHNLS